MLPKPALLYKRELKFWEVSHCAVTLVASIFRSSRSHMFYRIVFLKILREFTEKQLCWSLWFNEVTKRETPGQVSKNTYFKEHFWATASAFFFLNLIFLFYFMKFIFFFNKFNSKITKDNYTKVKIMTITVIALT